LGPGHIPPPTAAESARSSQRPCGRPDRRTAGRPAPGRGVVRIVVAATYVPFEEGDGDQVVDDLARELTARGFQTDTVKVPFQPAWPNVPEQTLALRLLDLSESSGDRIDRLITVGTPSYALRHPNKAVWFTRHRAEAYGKSGGSDDDAARREMVRRSD